MKQFVIKARRAPTNPKDLKSALGGDRHLESLIHSVLSAFFLAQDLRRDVVTHLVFESTADFSRVITFDSSEELSFAGFSEHSILNEFEDALKIGQKISKGMKVKVKEGIYISGISFEELIKELVTTSPCYLLDRKGDDVRESRLGNDCAIILTDHTPLPDKQKKYLKRLGVKKISLGPKILFAAHCISIIHNELDRY